ncbi:hypothetical protein BJV74DRAFT_954596 [Russula compacta]|nr:hypothetical protein BJV74DRAFT_954596 [Russula compacta]
MIKVFFIAFDIEDDVGDLEEALVAKHSGKGVEGAVIYKPKVPEPIKYHNIKELLNKYPLLEFATPCESTDTIREVFEVPSASTLPRTRLFARLLVPADAQPPQDDETREERDVVGQLEQSYKSLVTGVVKGPTPSNAAKSTEYNRIQGSRTAILDGRFNNLKFADTSAPPIELYHPAFGKFSTRARDSAVDVPDEILQSTARFLRRVSAISTNESRRDSESRGILAEILGIAFEHISNSDTTSSDFISIHTTKWHINAAPIICEIKSELGQGGSDPSVQSSFSFARFYCLDERSKIRDNSCCPAFIVGLAGPWIVIMGAVITSRVIVQRLSSYEWLGCSRILDDKQVFVAARLLYALRQGIDDLKAYYGTLETLSVIPGHIHPRFCPFISSFHDALTGSVVDFTYVAPLEFDPRSVTFKAIRQDTSETIVVKFVRRYGKEAHEWMAEHGQAPRLIRFEELGPEYDDMNVVVMEYVVGDTLHTLYPDELPPDVRSGVESALDVLTSGGFVFGDLRRPNVMLADGPGAIASRIRFIDFDWAGKEGPNLRYPFHISSFVRDVSGASDYGHILREHQDRMFKSL